MLEQRITTPAQQKWLAKFLGYASFVVEYKKGVDNRVVDTLSRKSNLVLENLQLPLQQKTSCLFLFLVLDPTWLVVLKDSYSQDPSIQQLFSSIQSGASPKGFTFQNDLIFYKGRFFLGPLCPFKSQVLQLVYSSPVADHSGFLKSF